MLLSKTRMLLMIVILSALMNEIRLSANGISINSKDKHLPSSSINKKITGRRCFLAVSSPDPACLKFLRIALFKFNGTFRVPLDVTRVRVLVVGGGQAGADGPYNGGSSGQIAVGQFDVRPRERIAITIGNGGTPGGYPNGNSGTASSFGNYLTAGGSGGSGGGQGCVGACKGGAGGSDGSSGQESSGGSPQNSPGTGQGPYAAALSVFTHFKVTPGAGGKGATDAHCAGGGGGGGVLINGSGPGMPDYDNIKGVSSGGAGGKGYGAGGGAGGATPDRTHYSGGRGVDGVVYIEW